MPHRVVSFRTIVLLAGLSVFATASSLHAGGSTNASSSASSSWPTATELTLADAAPTSSVADKPSGDTHHGLFNLLDSRSIYGQYWFPEPLSADEADVDNEIRVDYFHAEKRGFQSDEVHAEFEKSFGLLTLEIAPGYESDRASSHDPITGEVDHDNESGLTNIELGARYPIAQYVSPNNFFDDTFVFGLEFSPAVNTEVSKDLEIVPKLFNLLKLGDHLSVQTAFGISTLVGPEERGASTAEYDLVLGYELTHDALPIPGVLSTVPIVEVDGEWALNHEDAGENALSATLGARFNFDSIKGLPAQPRIGLGYSFPINDTAKQDIDWGIVVSVVFEY